MFHLSQKSFHGKALAKNILSGRVKCYYGQSCLLSRNIQSRVSWRKHDYKKILKVNRSFLTTILRPNATTAATANAIKDQIPQHANKWIGRWLFGCSGMVFGAVVLGGITRLTESGLSMVDWHIFKERPPLSHEEWEAEFLKYQQSPEFKYKHQHFTLSDFKRIWYMEYMHRMWGRTVGAFFLLPAAYFWHKGWFQKAMKVRVLAFGTLIGVQGLLGWYMVKSGLEEKQEDHYVPRVSPGRLAIHLGAAFILYTLFLWSGLALTLQPQQFKITKQVKNLWKMGHVTKGLAFLTVISGAFVAGLNAGLVYNTFPKMADKWIPDDILALEPKRKNFIENPTTVQFVHRILGTSTLIAVTSLWLYSRKILLPSRSRLAMNCLLAMGTLQVTLGISTLLLYVPVPLAACHQAGALALLSNALWVTHELKMVRRLPVVV